VQLATIVQNLLALSLLRAFHHRFFALVWIGQTLSRIGDFLYQVALAWWVLQKTGSAAAMGTVLVVSFTPMLLFFLICVVAVDRFSRARLMLLSDLLRGAVVGMVAMLAFTDLLEIWHVYVAGLIFGFVDAFFQPAYTAMVPTLVPPEALSSANSLSSMSVQTGRIAGPLLAAGMIGLGGTPLAFALNALTFFISAAFLVPLLRLPPPERALAANDDAGTEQRPTGVLRDVREGIATVLDTPWLLIGITVFALTNVTLAGPYSVAMPFLVKDHLHQDVAVLGFLYSMFPIGYLIGGVWLGRRTRIKRRGPIIYGGMAVAGLMLSLFGLSLPIAVLAMAALVNGAALEAGNLAWLSALQELVPNEKLGRVSSIDMLGSFVLLPIGFGLTGWLAEQIGPAQVFTLGGAIAAVLALLALTHPAVRGLD